MRQLGSPLVALAIFGVALGCGHASSSVPVARPPVQWDTTADLLPEDLDLVVRVGWSRLRVSPLRAAALQALPKTVAGLALGSVLDRARSLFVGVRWMPDGLQGDGVIAVEGDRTELTPGTVEGLFRNASFEDLSSGKDRHLLVRSGSVERFDPALLWVLEGRALVLATPAEADAVRRIAETGPDRDRLEPPARGLVSFALRAPLGQSLETVVQNRMRRLVAGLVAASGSLELGDDGLLLDLELGYESERAASGAGDSARSMMARLSQAGGELGADLRQACERSTFEVQGRAIVAKAVVPFRLLAKGL